MPKTSHDETVFSMTDREREIVYKGHIVTEVAKVLTPWLWEEKAMKEYSPAALKILRGNSRDKAKQIMRAIAPWMKPWETSGFNFEEAMSKLEPAQGEVVLGPEDQIGGGKIVHVTSGRKAPKGRNK